MRISTILFVVVAVFSMTAPPLGAFTLHTTARVDVVPQVEIRSSYSLPGQAGEASLSESQAVEGRLVLKVAGPEHLCVNVAYGGVADQARQLVHDAGGELMLEFLPGGEPRPVLSLIYE